MKKPPCLWQVRLSGLRPVSGAQGLAAGCTGVGFVVEIVVVGMIQRIRQVVLQFIAFYLIREILGFPRGGTGWAIGSRHGVLLGKIQSRANRRVLIGQARCLHADRFLPGNPR